MTGLPGPFVRRLREAAGLSALALAIASPAAAFDFDVGNGWSGDFDTTVSLGTTIRTASPNPAYISRGNGGTNPNSNSEQGDLNWGRGPVAAPLRATEELKLDNGDLGFFARATEFFDFVQYDNHSPNQFPLAHDAVTQAGYGGRLLDAYLHDKFTIDDSDVTVRLGRTAINWGESTFIPGGINSINPFDVSALHSPGSELREAILPIPVADVSATLGRDLSVEGYYQFQWQKTNLDANGTFFSTNDLATPGATYETLSGDLQDTLSSNPTCLIPAAGGGCALTAPSSLSVPRGLDRDGKNSGEYGIALRYTATWLEDSEFGFYFTRYNSNVPTLGWKAGSAAATENVSNFNNLLGKVLTCFNGASVAACTNPSAALGGQAPLNFALANDVVQAGANSAQYYVAYPDGIKSPAISFSTSIGSVSIQGEYSYKFDVPIQENFADVTLAGLTPALVDFGISANNLAPGTLATILADVNRNPLVVRALGGPVTLANYTKLYGYDFSGYERHDVQQLQFTATNLFGPHFGADDIVVLAEVGADYVPGLSDRQSTGIAYQGPNTLQPSLAAYCGLLVNPTATGAAGACPDLQTKGFATRFSWGYRVLVRGDYLGAWGPVNVQPQFAFSQDINGISPGPAPGNFIAGRKGLDFGLNFSYQNAWAASVSYTDYFGGKGQDPLTDRDFVALTIKYSF